MRTGLAITVLSLLAMLQLARAGGPDCCAHCGCKCPVRKVCRLVCEEKEVKEVKWTCKCEDFCVPGRSELCGERCQCDPSKPHCEDCDKVWKPTRCADVRTRKILVKNEVTKKVPHYKWVVEYCCDRCQQVGVTSAVPAAAETVGHSPTGAPPSTPATFEMAESPKLPWSPFFK